MNALLFILTGLIVLVGSGLVALAPIFEKQEARRVKGARLRVAGVCCTTIGAVLGIVFGLRSAKKTDALMRNAQEAFSFSSGGDSRPEIAVHRVTREDGKQYMGFYLTKRGKYPLFGLNVMLGKPRRSPENRNSLIWDALQSCRSIEEFHSEMQLPYTVPLCFEPLPQEDSTYYEADMGARNGQWEEVIRIVKTADGGVATRWALFESRDITITPNKQVFDLADSNFPGDERWKKIHPLLEVLP